MPANKLHKIKPLKRTGRFILRLFFPGVDFNRMWFTFGKTIYGPANIPEDIFLHEQVHIAQQKNWFIGCFCFIMYVSSAKFRYKVELPGYQAQLNYWRQKDFGRIDKYRIRIAEILSGPEYNNMVEFYQAYNDLKVIL